MSANGDSHLDLQAWAHRLGGLRPEAWLCVGAGFAREDVKAFVLSRGFGFTSDSITTLQELCLKLTGLPSERLLSSPARQEVLRMLLAEPRITSGMTELKRIRRQRNFFRRLDSALQSGRMTFAHAQEEEVYEERLAQALGTVNPVRQELRSLSRAYEAWCEASSFLDLPMLIHKAIQVLEEGLPAGVALAQEIWPLSIQNPESLEKEFWDLLGRHVLVRPFQSLTGCATWAEGLEWQSWHTLDDAAEALADALSEMPLDTSHAVLIPDLPAVRRTLKRALDSRNLILAEPRDPTQLRWDEKVKWGLLSLDVIGRNFERQRVVSWLRSWERPPELSTWVAEINSRGIRHGLGSYSGGILVGLHSRLKEMETALGGRRTCRELAETHLAWLKSSPVLQDDQTGLIDFFKSSWDSFSTDMERVGQGTRKAPLLFWLERLQARFYEAAPPVERLKPREGVRLYRLQQAPVSRVERLWVLGLPFHWLNGNGTGNYWFNEREREILGLEFSVRSSNQIHDERLALLKNWIGGASQVTLLDAGYDPEGRERESNLPILNELEIALGVEFPQAPKEMGAHPRFSRSYGAIRPLQEQKIQLPPLPFGPEGTPPVVSATALDRYSRCSFQALGYHRWKLRDLREPDTELWPDVRGNILHEAVKVLLQSMDSEGHFRILPREALDRAWKAKRPLGLIRSPRVENYVRSRMETVLEVFCEKEREYIQRAGTRAVSLEDLFFRLEYLNFHVVGQPDRIDQHPEGVFILDYKTSGTVPHGAEMFERGYRLQLPFYALAARKRTSQPILGVQFVELDRKGGRKSGIFFKPYNGKDKGKLTNARSNSKSLFSAHPDEIWDQFDLFLQRDGDSYVNGQFEAMPRVPKREKECSRCGLADLCGFRRIVELEAEAEAIHE